MAAAWCWMGTRIIPADAGSTDICNAYRDGEEDHPRGCGEHLSEMPARLINTGSSPRMRGARSCRVRLRSGARIIPADARSTRYP